MEQTEDIDLSLYKIMIFTRSMNYRLFELSSDTTRSLPFKHIRIKHTSADGYFYKILKYDIDYAINIDEDAFVFDTNKLLDLLKYCIANNIINCGFPDGGVLFIREYNPIVTNPFFNILNVKEIKKKLNYGEIDNFDFKQYDYEAKIPKHLFRTFLCKFEYSLEPYYPFFLWLNLNFKVLYLDADEDTERVTTLLKDMNGDIFLAHAWFSRYYLKESVHTNRINNLYLRATGKQVRKFNRLQDKCNSMIDILSFYYTKVKLHLKRNLKKYQWVKYV
jgi:hypothetical protein